MRPSLLATPPRRALAIAACMAAATIVSFMGAALADRPGLDAAAAPLARRVVLMLAFGAAACIAAWLHVRAVDERTSSPSWPALLAGAIAIQLGAALALPLTSNDLFSNLAYGRLAHLGINPYFAGPSSLPHGDAFAALAGARWAKTVLVYGPLLAFVDTLAVIGGVLPSLILWKALFVACALGVVALCFVACRSIVPAEHAASAFVLVAWSPLFAWEVAAQAHNDGLLVLALCAAVWTGSRGRALPTTLLLTLAVLVKFAAAPLLALQLWAIARRSPTRAIALAATAALLSLLAFSPWWQGLATLKGPLLAASGEPGRTARSLVDLVCLALSPLGENVKRIAFLIGARASLLIVIALFLRALPRVRTFEDAAHHGLLVLLAWQLTTPWFQPWYVTWLLPLALIERDAALRRTIALFAAFNVAQYALPIDPITHVALDIYIVWRLLRRRASP